MPQPSGPLLCSDLVTIQSVTVLGSLSYLQDISFPAELHSHAGQGPCLTFCGIAHGLRKSSCITSPLTNTPAHKSRIRL